MQYGERERPRASKCLSIGRPEVAHAPRTALAIEFASRISSHRTPSAAPFSNRYNSVEVVFVKLTNDDPPRIGGYSVYNQHKLGFATTGKLAQQFCVGLIESRKIGMGPDKCHRDIHACQFYFYI